MLLDKTGTLTAGAAGAVEVRTTGGLDVATALAIAAALESASKHPLAYVPAACAHRARLAGRLNPPARASRGQRRRPALAHRPPRWVMALATDSEATVDPGSLP